MSAAEADDKEQEDCADNSVGVDHHALYAGWITAKYTFHEDSDSGYVKLTFDKGKNAKNKDVKLYVSEKKFKFEFLTQNYGLNEVTE